LNGKFFTFVTNGKSGGIAHEFSPTGVRWDRMITIESMQKGRGQWGKILII